MAESVEERDSDKEISNVEQNGFADEIDEKKVETAIKFLQNPNVRKTTFANRVAFLKKKGLHQREIDIAIDRSGTKGDKDMNYKEDHKLTHQQQQGIMNMPSQAMVPHSKPRSFGSHVSSVVIGGGIIYAAIFLCKKYVIPYFIGKEQDEVKELEKNIKELNKGITELSSLMRDTIHNIEVKIENQQDILSNVSSEVDIMKRKLELIPSDVTSLSDVRAEISSVKGLLLGRHQFPATPFSSTSPSIPAWQKASAKKRQADAKHYEEDTPADGKMGSEENSPDCPKIYTATNLIITDNADYCGAKTDNESCLSDEANDNEVAELTDESSKSFSSSYVKVNDD